MITDLLNYGRVTKAIKSRIIDELKNIRKSTSKDDNKIIDKLIDILEKKILTPNDKEKICKLQVKIVKIVATMNVTEIPELDEGTTHNEVPVLDERNEIEDLLDKGVKKYNKFTEKHPMQGVTWNSSKNSYTVIYALLIQILKT